MARGRRDRISRLPDELLLHILSFLPIKYALLTSLLSKRWSDLLIFLPSFDFSFLSCRRSRHILVNSVDNLITVNTCPTISKFRFHVPFFRRKYLSQLNAWLRTLLSRNLIELDLNIFFRPWSRTKCLRLLPCQSLQILKLHTNIALDVPISRGCFPNLRIFHLRYEGTQGRPFCEELAANLFPNLPLLEELSIEALLWSSDRQVMFNIIAPALKIFSFYEHHVDKDEHCSGVKIVLDAPLLENICLSHYNIASYSFKTRPFFSVAKVSVGVSLRVDGGLVGHNYVVNYSYNPEYIVKTMDLLWGVSNAKSISLSETSVLALVISRQKDMPAFPFLTELKLVIPSACAWKLLLPLIVNSPNLEVLILKVTGYYYKSDYDIEDEAMLADLVGEFQFVPPTNIPACLLVHLKEIEVKGVKKIEEFEVLEYIVKNAQVLNKLTVSLDV